MTTAGLDGIGALRRYLYELVVWFERGNRFGDAQRAWRGDAERQSRVDERAFELHLAAGEGRAFELMTLDDARSPLDALRELCAVDLVAWELRGAAANGPPDRFGDGDDARYVVPRWREIVPRAASQPGRLSTYVQHHALVPTHVRVPNHPTPIRVDVRVVTELSALENVREVRLASIAFHDGATIAWCPPLAEEKPSRAAGLDLDAARDRRLLETIAACARRGTHVLVAPELAMTPRARDSIAKHLRLARAGAPSLIVPGSFHEQVGDRFVNVAVLLSATGNRLVAHEKLVAYGSLEKAAEDIDAGATATLLVTPVGTVAIAICKDFCDVSVGRVWHALAPDWMLVPAYGGGAHEHERAARDLGISAGSVTVLAHQAEREPFGGFIRGTDIVRTACDDVHDVCCDVSVNESGRLTVYREKVN